MKKRSATLIFILFTFLFSFFQLQAEEKNKSLLGEWLYEVSDVPPEYETGSLIFSENEGQTVCVIKMEVGEIPVSNLVIEKKKITFSAYADGNEVKFEFIREKDKLSGKIDSHEGIKIMTAVKKQE